jgi:hypothetical protein
MIKARQDGVLLFVLAGAIFLAAGFIMLRDSATPDFKGIYYGARCLLHRGDPYNKNDIRRIYDAEAWQRPPDPPDPRNFPFVMAQIYFPSALVLALPFVGLAWGPAHFLWMGAVVVSFLLAAFLAWDLAADYAPILSACLIGYIVVNSLVLFTSGNPAGIAVSLCVIAAWCFLRERFIVAGVLCLAVSLALKPHDAGLIWLYFLLAGGAQRKRALQSLVIVAALVMAGSIWVSHVAPHWIPEIRANFAEDQQHDSIDDPNPNSTYAHTASTIIDLQSVVSFFRNDPRVYNPISYLVVGTLLLVWLIPTIRSRSSHATALLALAPIIALTMLPVYHRACDAKLLMLAVPACCLLIAEGGLLASLAALLSVSAIVLTGDIPLVVLLNLSDHIRLSATELPVALFKIAIVRPVPLALLVMTIVNLLVYARRARQSERP